MPMTGPFRSLPAMAREVAKLGKPGSAHQKAVAKAVVKEVRDVLRVQFDTGTGPDGRPWRLTKRGRLALISRKLPQDFRGIAVEKGAFFFSRIPWLIAHHRGHKFPARSQTLTFNGDVKSRKFGSLARRSTTLFDIATRRGVFKGKAVFDVEANVGARELPERPIYPERMTDRWAKAINRGAYLAFEHLANEMQRKVIQGV